MKSTNRGETWAQCLSIHMLALRALLNKATLCKDLWCLSLIACLACQRQRGVGQENVTRAHTVPREHEWVDSAVYLATLSSSRLQLSGGRHSEPSIIFWGRLQCP